MDFIVEKLDVIEKQLKELAKSYTDLKVDYKILQEDNLKLTELIQQFKNEKINNKEESEESLKTESRSGLQSQILPEHVEILSANSNTEQNVQQIKLELENYISEIDQCIEIIQSK